MTGYKILTLEQLRTKLGIYHRPNVQVVHCHGCFDPLHIGHVVHLEAARNMGDVLVVSVTADIYVDKGLGRPFLPEGHRARTLAGLEAVDWVLVNPYVDACPLLEVVRPNLYVKGKEYEGRMTSALQREELVVAQHGGRLAFTGGDCVYSSTQLVAQLRGAAWQDR